MENLLRRTKLSTGPHADRGFDIAGVEGFSSVSENTGWSFQVSVILQEIRSG